MTETTRRKPAWRHWWFWLLVLVLAWLIAGFGLVPMYLSSAVPERTQQALGWDLETGDIHFNPFTFTLSAENVNATDSGGERVFAADEVALNLGFLQLIRGSINAQALSLENPFLRLDIRPDGSTNLMNDWRQHGGVDKTDQDSGTLAWQLGEGRVSNGRLQLRRLDENGRESRTFTFDALDLSITNVSGTHQDQAGSYTLQAVLESQKLEANGSLNIEPLWSNGRLALSRVSADALQNWLGGYLPWRINSGRVSFETAYQFAHDDRGVALATRDGQLDARNLELTDPQAPEQVLASADRLTMQAVAYNMDGPELVISAIAGESLHLDLVMTAEGGLNLTHPLRSENADNADNADNATEEEQAGSALRWSVGRLDISKSTIDWRDERPETPVELTLQDVELNLGAMTEQLEEPIAYQARTTLAEGGSASANGQFTLAPLTFEGGVNLDQLQLTVFNGYLAEVSELEVREGMLNLSGNIDIDVQDSPLTGTFSGQGSISLFSGRLPDEDESTVAWRELRLEPIEYNFSPARLELGTVTLSEPELGVVQYPNRPLNLVRVLGAGEEGEADDEAAPSLIFRLRQLDLSNGEIRYTDHTPQPSFTIRLHDLQASVAGLSNITPQQGRFTLRGILEESGKFQASGTLATLGTRGQSEIDASLTDLSMPVLNPYFSFYLGYRVDSGKLSADGHYELAGTQLEATNKLVLERLELGEQVQSDSEITAPVRLGLALLRDDRNRVELDIPVSGNLTDPQFNLGPVMMRTLRASLVKAALSPFNLLGAIVDVGDYNPEDLGGVSFLAGETTLGMGEYTKMETVARILEAREEIVLTIRGIALESVDRPALERLMEEDQAVPEGALEALATHRGASLKRLLTEEYEVAEEQIFLKAPEVRPGEEQDGPVTIEFELESR